MVHQSDGAPGSACSMEQEQHGVCMGMQGDREKEIGLTVSPLMDRRHKGGITRSQVRLSGTLTKHCIPLAFTASVAVMQQGQLDHITRARWCRHGYGQSAPASDTLPF